MLRFEGTVMSGTPVLRAGQQLLASAGVRRIKGILNGTTNYVLMRMESGYSYSSALAEAQKLGYAEANPVGDIEGHDSVAKLIILAQVFFGQTIRASDVSREGITQVSAERIAGALESGERWKLVASLWREGERLRATVLPERLSLTHPLAGVGGATNAICFDTELLGAVTMAGPGAGRIPTGYAVLSDLLAIAGK
jgi:homoserine dehydrogenase